MEKEVVKLSFKNVFCSFYYESAFIKKSELAEYKEWINYALEAIDDFSDLKKELYINLSLTSDQEIKEINQESRGKDSITDVLSFPMEENIRKGEYDDFLPELDVGDILICKSLCEAQAKEFKISYMEEFVHLFMHGFLHVWGYDHEINEEEEKLMTKLEEDLIKKISEIKNS
jgi:rRNA maturation RNase YbeY